MTEFKLHFDRRFSSVSIPDGHVTYVKGPPGDGTPDRDIDATAIETIQTLVARLGEVEGIVCQQLDELKERMVVAAAAIAEAVLGEESELVQMRARHYADVSFSQAKGIAADTIVVHPDCRETIADWLQQSHAEGVTLKEDPTLLPGDCRIEAAGAGFSATLQSHLDAIIRRLGEQVGGN